MAAFGHIEGVREALLGQYPVKRLGALIEEVGVADADPVEPVAVVLEGTQLGPDFRRILRTDGQGADVVEGRRIELRGREGVASAHRQAGNGPGGGLRDGAEVTLYERDDLGYEAVDIGIGIAGAAGVEACVLEAEGLSGLLGGIAVGHHDDHRDGLTALDEVVEDLCGAAHRGPGLLVTAASVEEVQHGILDLLVLGILVSVRGVDYHTAVDAEQRAVIPHRGQRAAMLGLVISRGALAGYEDHIEVAGAVTLDTEIDRVVDGHSVHDEVVGVDLGLERGNGDFPDASLPFLHRDGGGGIVHPVAGQGDDRGVVGGQAEGHGAVGKNLRRDDLLPAGEVRYFLGGSSPREEQDGCEECHKPFHIQMFSVIVI